MCTNQTVNNNDILSAHPLKFSDWTLGDWRSKILQCPLAEIQRLDTRGLEIKNPKCPPAEIQRLGIRGLDARNKNKTLKESDNYNSVARSSGSGHTWMAAPSMP